MELCHKLLEEELDRVVFANLCFVVHILGRFNMDGGTQKRLKFLRTTTASSLDWESGKGFSTTFGHRNYDFLCTVMGAVVPPNTMAVGLRPIYIYKTNFCLRTYICLKAENLSFEWLVHFYGRYIID
mmetsp:Transcript_12878/g.17278  ORF Transcript_12878/g.17278 Transcript_12878/m.17278 type:complete len:127 (-) Transcript_12878:52-432(-)